MAQPRVKNSQFRLVAFIAAAALIYPWSFATPSSRPVGCAPYVNWKHVAFGVDSTEHFVESDRDRHWPSRSKSCNVLNSKGTCVKPLYVGFGPNHQYYYEFEDGSRYLKIDDPDIEKIVKENAVKFVSFGPKGAVIVVLKSGAYYFRNLPTYLQDCITGRARSGNEDYNRIASVSLGNNDAYFVTFEDGSAQWSANIPSSMSEYIDETGIAKNSDETFEQIAFSQDLDEWYVRTNKRERYSSRTLLEWDSHYESDDDDWD